MVSQKIANPIIMTDPTGMDWYQEIDDDGNVYPPRPTTSFIAEEIYALINNDPVLTDKEKKRSLKYIASFYEILNKERLLFSYLKVK